MTTINTILRNSIFIFVIFSLSSFVFFDANKFEIITNRAITPKIIKLQEDNFMLKWETNGLKGIDFFMVQMSTGQKKFINIGQILKKSKTTFQFIDKFRNFDYLSYRLVTVFKDGTFAVSRNEIVRINKDIIAKNGSSNIDL